jgi:hypothetical protein
MHRLYMQMSNKQLTRILIFLRYLIVIVISGLPINHCARVALLGVVSRLRLPYDVHFTTQGFLNGCRASSSVRLVDKANSPNESEQGFLRIYEQYPLELCCEQVL